MVIIGLLMGCAIDEFADLNDVPTIPAEKINADDTNRPTITIEQD